MPKDVDDRASLRMRAQELLSESVEAASNRERHTFEKLAGEKNGSIVLFGAGGLGRRCLAALRRSAVEPVAFADNNPRLWHSQIEGVSVLSPIEAARRFGKSSVFVVTIWGARGADRIVERLDAVRELGCETVVAFGPLLWRYPGNSLPHYAVDLPHRVLDHRNDILRALDLWSDQESVQEYVAQLRWRLSFDSSGMSKPEVDKIYFPPDLIRLRSDELFVDCGAFDGDTIRQFVATSNGRFANIIAFEPDPTNFARLNDSVNNLPEAARRRIETCPAALATDEATVRFSADGSPSSHVGEGNLEVEAISLDRYLDQRRATFIKMDIEGAEPEALKGVVRHIREDTPILAVSCYHRQDHLWTIPLLIDSMNDDYSFYLRPHDFDSWDLVCYAIPRNRAPTQ